MLLHACAVACVCCCMRVLLHACARVGACVLLFRLSAHHRTPSAMRACAARLPAYCTVGPCMYETVRGCGRDAVGTRLVSAASCVESARGGVQRADADY